MILYANIIAGIAELVGLLANSNQLVHVIRKKTILGVSGWAWTLQAGGNIAWVVYGFQKHIVALIIANLILIVVSFGMISKLYKVKSQRRRMASYSLLVGVGLSVVFMGFPNYAGWLAVTYGTLSRLPQMYRAHVDHDLKGLSYNSQIALFFENFLTGLYALMLGAWPLVVAALFGFFTVGYMVIMVAKKGKTT